MGGILPLSKKKKEECEGVVESMLTKTVAAYSIPIEDVYPLYKIFTKIDKDDSKNIGMDEMLFYYGLPSSQFANRVFDHIDMSCDRRIDFGECVRFAVERSIPAPLQGTGSCDMHMVDMQAVDAMLSATAVAHEFVHCSALVLTLLLCLICLAHW